MAPKTKQPTIDPTAVADPSAGDANAGAGRRVLVLGAGVAGLTAAHELAVRGFSVTVVEEHPYLVGGLARSQYCRAPPPGDAGGFHALAEESVSFKDAIKVSAAGARGYLPGEHGYRFFPAFYRHLTDTMERTPCVDRPNGAEGDLERGRRTLADNLIPTRVVGYAPGAAGGGRVRVRRFERAAINLETFAGFVSDFTSSASLAVPDLELLQLALLQYVTSGPERRRDLERVSWWDFIHAPEMSRPAREWLNRSPEALVAMSAKQSDARTYGSIAVQMMLDQLGNDARTDRTLNGPTSEAWLEPWKLFLERRLGVKFNMGERVTQLLVDAAGALSGVDTEKGGSTEEYRFGNEFDLVVCALPLQAIGRLLEASTFAALNSPEDADLQRLSAFWKASARTSEAGNDVAPTSTGWRGFGRQSGIQFYLKERLHFLRGHVFGVNTPWGLTAISQSQFWREDLRHQHPNVGTILSVDIGVWDARPTGGSGKTASEATSGIEIAREVWRQLRDAVGSGAVSDEVTDREIVPRAKLPEVPWAWHIDSELFNPSNKVTGGLLLINRPGDYALRPGQIAQPSRGYDLVLGGRLVFAGPHMQTFTRLTTMEAANESARHAVNGILRARSYAGDGCAIFPLERLEIPETATLKRLDRALYADGLAHAAELLRAREWLRAFTPR